MHPARDTSSCAKHDVLNIEKLQICSVGIERHLPDQLHVALKHEENTWLALIACEDHKAHSQKYSYLRMAHAMLVSVMRKNNIKRR
jgi:hypothetical protein